VRKSVECLAIETMLGAVRRSTQIRSGKGQDEPPDLHGPDYLPTSTPHLPPSFALCLQYLQFQHALQGLAPTQVAVLRLYQSRRQGPPGSRTPL
jgi:hypothetical protein